MKATITPATEKPKFPAMYQHKIDKYIVLFISARAGLVLESESRTYPVEFCSITWVACTDTDTWEPYHGKYEIEGEC